MKKIIFSFSALIVALLVLFQLSKYSYMSGDLAIEFIIAVVALTFLALGFYINKKSVPKLLVETKTIDQSKIKALGISDREYQVLQYLTKGLSNKEIAAELFVSESTIKTHVSNLFIKLDAKRRTQAIKKAKEYQIIGP